MKNYEYYLNYHLVLFFGIIILLPFVNAMTGTWTFKRESENRTFKDDLDININRLDVFPKECEAYVNDNFPFRTPMLQLNNHIKTQYLKVSPNPKKTLIGKDGWCFSADKSLELYEGKLNFTKEELVKFSTEWTRRKNFLDSMDVKYYWLIGPSKFYVYPEKLPIYITQKNTPRRLDQVKDQLKESFPRLIIDPTAEFHVAKKTQKLYHKLDNHWLHSAGYIASNALLSAMRLDFPDRSIGDLPNYEWEEKKRWDGIHTKVLGTKNNVEISLHPIITNEQSEKAPLYDFPVPKGFPYPKEYEMRYINTQDTASLSVLFIRDSFAKLVMPYVNETFSETLYIFDYWQYRLNEHILEKMKPDAVVFLTYENNIDAIIRDFKK